MDDELKGEGNSANYKYRMHDPRIGRFFAMDPLRAKYPFYSPYAFSGNRVIDANELEGLEPQIHNSIDTDHQPFNKGVMQYDYATQRLNIVPTGTNICANNFTVGMYTIEAIYDNETGEVLAYLASVPGMTNDYVDPEIGRVYLQNQVRYDWVIDPESLDEFKENVGIYEWSAAFYHNFGAKFSLSDDDFDVIDGHYLTYIGKQWLSALKNPFYWVQTVGGAIIAKGPTSSCTEVNIKFKDLSNTGRIHSKVVRYSQNTVSNRFSDGTKVSRLSRRLKSGKASPDDIKPIRIVEKDGKIYTLDNRRLKAAKDANVSVRYEKLDHIPKRQQRKFSTENEGESVKVVKTKRKRG